MKSNVTIIDEEIRLNIYSYILHYSGIIEIFVILFFQELVWQECSRIGY